MKIQPERYAKTKYIALSPNIFSIALVLMISIVKSPMRPAAATLIEYQGLRWNVIDASVLTEPNCQSC